ncbi:MAG: protease Do, partial [Thiothrix sp.]
MLTRQPLVALLSALLGTALLVNHLPAAAETASTFPLSQAPAAAPLTTTVLSTPASAAGSLPELTNLIKQNSPAVVSIRVEGSAKRRIMNSLPPELERFFRGMPGP